MWTDKTINWHTTTISNKILKAPNNLIVICDGTYSYCQKSSNYLVQKRLYSVQKKRPLTKPFIIITTDGYYLDVEKPMEATKNDASILTTLLSRRKFRHFFKEGDVFVLDRGFRNVLGDLH